LCACFQKHTPRATPEGVSHAFITGPNGVGMVDLHSLVDLPNDLKLTNALDINNAGQVLALTAVIPEPEIYAMLLGGLGLNMADNQNRALQHSMNWINSVKRMNGEKASIQHAFVKADGMFREIESNLTFIEEENHDHSENWVHSGELA